MAEMGGAQQLAPGTVGPAMEGADDVTTGFLAQVAASLEHDGLTVPADIGDELDAFRGVHERTPLVFLGQGVVIPHIRYGCHMADVARPLGKNGVELAPEKRFAEIAADGELAFGLL